MDPQRYEDKTVFLETILPTNTLTTRDARHTKEKRHAAQSTSATRVTVPAVCYPQESYSPDGLQTVHPWSRALASSGGCRQTDRLPYAAVFTDSQRQQAAGTAEHPRQPGHSAGPRGTHGRGSPWKGLCSHFACTQMNKNPVFGQKVLHV